MLENFAARRPKLARTGKLPIGLSERTGAPIRCFVKGRFLHVLIIEFDYVRGGAFTGFPVSVCHQHSPSCEMPKRSPYAR